MAIIFPPPSSGLEAVVVGGLRPALPIEDGRIRPDPGSLWFEPLATAADVVARAARATARLETSEKDLDFIGTAFAVSPTLAAATAHIARLMLQKGQGAVYRLNFSSDGSEADKAIGVKVKLIHPYFDFALLEMDRPVGEDSILSFSATIPDVKEKIALVGYPANDPRNDPDTLAAVFGNVLGTKRLMPGTVVDGAVMSTSAGTDVPALIHDASCTSGTSGAPVIQLSTGHVVGIHYAGLFLQKNFAVPAWELARDPFMLLSDLRIVGAEIDPHWLPLWKEKLTILHADVEAFRASKLNVPDIPPRKKQAQLLTTDEINELHALLVHAGFGPDIELRTLFAGLPVELRGELPDGSPATVRLLNCLHDLNQRTELLPYENHTSLYIVISSAKAVKLALQSDLQRFLTLLKAKEKALTQAQGLASIATPPSASFRYIANVIGKIGGKPIEFHGWSNDELRSRIGKIQITFPSPVAGFQMLRGLAVGNNMRPFTIQETNDKFVLRVEEDPS
jgi:hypothetical protein